MGTDQSIISSAMKLSMLLLAAGLVAMAAGEAVELTQSNFEAEVYGSGKNAIVKFLAPW